MSRFLIWGSSLLLAIAMMVAAPVQKAKAQPGVSVSFQTFYDQLSPHGQWIDDPEYGYVWSPRGVGRDFRPYYSGGNWAMTDYGNTWVSDYPWGWAPFHYGRWAYNPFYGWLWVPGNTWGPAWVHWRGGGGNYGWAPMGPGVNININIGGGRGYYPQNDWWTFVPCNRIYNRGGYGRYWRGSQYNNTYINNTTIINNTNIYNNNTYVIGPRRGDVERTTGQRVNVYNLRNDNNPGRNRISGREVSMYRPEVRQDRSANARPQNVVRAERGNRDANQMRTNDGIQENRSFNDNGQNGLSSVRQRDAQVQQQRVEQASEERSGRNREVAGQRRDAQMQQERSARHSEAAERQQRDMQMQQERSARSEVAERQQRDAQMQQERANRNSQMAERQQRDMQMQQERSARNAEIAERQQRDMQAQSRNREMAMQRQQQESQARIQQQRAAEQRAQQQQQIESRRQQRYQQSAQPQQMERSQPQQRSIERGGGNNGIQRMERSQPQAQPSQNMSRGGESRGRR